MPGFVVKRSPMIRELARRSSSVGILAAFIAAIAGMLVAGPRPAPTSLAQPAQTNHVFLPPVVYLSGGIVGHFSVALGDVNGDGKPDMVAANSCLDLCDTNPANISV